MQQHTEATGGRRYAAGDAVKVRISLDDKPHLKEIRLAFIHEADKQAVIVVKGEGTPVVTENRRRMEEE